MRKIKNLIIVYCIINLSSLWSCTDSVELAGSVLKDESVIIENYYEKIQDLKERIKKAESKNLLQNQLDLKREMDFLVASVNKSLLNCMARRDNALNVPFSQPIDTSRYRVRETKIINCFFNRDIMEFQLQLVAFATALGNSGYTLEAEMYSSSGELLKLIEFKMTNDFPEKGKPVFLIAHAEGKDLLRKISNIKFK